MGTEREKIEIQADATFEPAEGVVNAEHAESITYKIEKTANHTEISIMKSQWKLICTKVNRIKLGKWNINFKEIIIGATLPYGFDIISSYRSGESPDYFPVIICILLYIIVGFFVSKFPSLQGDNSERNALQLQEIKEIIEEINENNSDKSK